MDADSSAPTGQMQASTFSHLAFHTPPQATRLCRRVHFSTATEVDDFRQESRSDRHALESNLEKEKDHSAAALMDLLLACFQGELGETEFGTESPCAETVDKGASSLCLLGNKMGGTAARVLPADVSMSSSLSSAISGVQKGVSRPVVSNHRASTLTRQPRESHATHLDNNLVTCSATPRGEFTAQGSFRSKAHAAVAPSSELSKGNPGCRDVAPKVSWEPSAPVPWSVAREPPDDAEKRKDQASSRTTLLAVPPNDVPDTPVPNSVDTVFNDGNNESQPFLAASTQCLVCEPQLQWIQQSKHITQQWRMQCDMLQAQMESLQSEVAELHSSHHRKHLEFETLVRRLLGKLEEAEREKSDLCDEKMILATELCKVRQKCDEYQTQIREHLDTRSGHELCLEERLDMIFKEHSKELNSMKRELAHWKRICGETARERDRLEGSSVHSKTQLFVPLQHSERLWSNATLPSSVHVSFVTTNHRNDDAAAAAQSNYCRSLMESGRYIRTRGDGEALGSESMAKDEASRVLSFILIEKDAIRRQHIAFLRRELAQAEHDIRSLCDQRTRSAAVVLLEAPHTQHKRTLHSMEKDLKPSGAETLQLHKLELRPTNHRCGPIASYWKGCKREQDGDFYETGRLQEHRRWVQFLFSANDTLLEWLQREGSATLVPKIDQEVSFPLQVPSYYFSTAADGTNCPGPTPISDAFEIDAFFRYAENLCDALIELLKKNLRYWREAALRAHATVAEEVLQKVLNKPRSEGCASIHSPAKGSPQPPVAACAAGRETVFLEEICPFQGSLSTAQRGSSAPAQACMRQAREWDMVGSRLEQLCSLIQNLVRECGRPAATSYLAAGATLTQSLSSTAVFMDKNDDARTVMPRSASFREENEGNGAATAQTHVPSSSSRKDACDLTNNFNCDAESSEDTPKVIKEAPIASLHSSTALTSLANILEASYANLLQLIGTFCKQQGFMRRARSNKDNATTALEAGLLKERKKNASLQARVARFQRVACTRKHKLRKHIKPLKKRLKHQQEEFIESSKRFKEAATQKTAECVALQARLDNANEYVERLSRDQGRLAVLAQEHELCLEALREATEDLERLRSRPRLQEEHVILLERELCAERENTTLLYTALEQWVRYTICVCLDNNGLINQLKWYKLLGKANRAEQVAIRQWLLQQRPQFPQKCDFSPQEHHQPGIWAKFFKAVGIAIVALIRLRNLARAGQPGTKVSASVEWEEDTGAITISGLNTTAAWLMRRSNVSEHPYKEGVAAGADHRYQCKGVFSVEGGKAPLGDTARGAQASCAGSLEGRAGVGRSGRAEAVLLYPLLLSLVGSAASPVNHIFPLYPTRRNAFLPVKLPPIADFISYLKPFFQHSCSNDGICMEEMSSAVHNKAGFLPIALSGSPQARSTHGSNAPLELSSRSSKNDENGGSMLGGLNRLDSASGGAKNLSIDFGTLIDYVLRTMYVELGPTRSGKDTAQRSHASQEFKDQLTPFLFPFCLLPAPSSRSACELASAGFVGLHIGCRSFSTFEMLMRAWNQLQEENGALLAQLQECTKDIEVSIAEREELKKVLAIQRMTFEGEKREINERMLDASKEASSLLRTAETQHQHLRESLQEAQHNWQKALHGRRRAEEAVARHQQEKFEHMALVYRLRNEIRSLNLELSISTGREHNCYGPRDQLLLQSIDAVDAQHKAFPSILAANATGACEDNRGEKICANLDTHDFLDDFPFLDSEVSVLVQEHQCGFPICLKNKSPNQKHLAQRSHTSGELSVQVDNVNSVFRSGDSRPECPSSSISAHPLSTTLSDLMLTTCVRTESQVLPIDSTLPCPRCSPITFNALGTSDN